MIITESSTGSRSQIEGTGKREEGSLIYNPYSIKGGPGQCPISEPLVYLVHCFKQFFFFVSLLKEVQLAPFFFKKRDPHSQEPNGLGVMDRFKKLKGLLEDFMTPVNPLVDRLLF